MRYPFASLFSMKVYGKWSPSVSLSEQLENTWNDNMPSQLYRDAHHVTISKNFHVDLCASFCDL